LEGHSQNPKNWGFSAGEEGGNWMNPDPGDNPEGKTMRVLCVLAHV